MSLSGSRLGRARVSARGRRNPLDALRLRLRSNGPCILRIEHGGVRGEVQGVRQALECLVIRDHLLRHTDLGHEICVARACLLRRGAAM